MRFTVGGTPLDLTEDDVVRAVKEIEPEQIREHYVVVNRRHYPVKQVFTSSSRPDDQPQSRTSATTGLRAGEDHQA